MTILKKKGIAQIHHEAVVASVKAAEGKDPEIRVMKDEIAALNRELDASPNDAPVKKRREEAIRRFETRYVGTLPDLP